MVYFDYEFIGKNVFGRKNRFILFFCCVYFIEYCYLDFCGDNMDEFIKVVNVINSGIRVIFRK